MLGDSSAIERFVHTYQQDVYRLALSILDDSNEADDATQDTLLAVLRSLDSFRGDSSFTTWLYSITVNICRTRLQRHKRRQILTDLLNGIFQFGNRHTSSAEEAVIKNESDTALWQAVHKMNGKHRIPIVLRYYHDLSIAEIANILGIPEGTVHSRLNIARKHLHDILKEGRS